MRCKNMNSVELIRKSSSDLAAALSMKPTGQNGSGAAAGAGKLVCVHAAPPLKWYCAVWGYELRIGA